MDAVKNKFYFGTPIFDVKDNKLLYSSIIFMLLSWLLKIFVFDHISYENQMLMFEFSMYFVSAFIYYNRPNFVVSGIFSASQATIAILLTFERKKWSSTFNFEFVNLIIYVVYGIHFKSKMCNTISITILCVMLHDLNLLD